MLLALLSSNGKMIHKKTITGNHEELIDRARELLQRMEEKDAMDMLKADGVTPEVSYLVVKAAKILAEPYVFEEHQSRKIITYHSST